MSAALELHEGLPPASAFFPDSTFLPATMGEWLRDAYHFRRGTDGKLYHYANGVFLPTGEQHAKEVSRNLLANRFKAAYVNETLYWLHCEAAEIGFEESPDWLNVANGMLCLKTGELHEHDPKYLSRIQIPVRWNPDARAVGIDDFLAEMLPADAIPIVYELIGASLLAEYRWREIVVLLGPGSNGKGVLLRILRALLGRANASSVTLQSFSESRFHAAELAGKLANIGGDLDARSIERTDIIKELTGGDRILAERKYSDPFEFTSFATQWFAANELPISRDQSEGWFSRVLPIPMKRTVEPSERDPDLTRKLTTDLELESLLVLSVTALRELMERGAFAIPPSVEEERKRYRAQLDSVIGFLEDECRPDPTAFTLQSDLYRAYETYCDESNRGKLGKQAFFKRLKEPEAARRGLRHRRRSFGQGFMGVALGADPSGEHDSDAST